MSLLIVGCGYVGLRVAQQWLDQSLVVSALTRSQVRGRELERLGIQPIIGHWIGDTLSLASQLAKVEHVLVAVPPREDLGMGKDSHRLGLQRLISALPEGWGKLVYLSTTGVYGESNNQMVDEATPVSPTRIAGEIAVEAENWLAENVAPDRYGVLRLAGIYGPGRIPFIETLRKGEPLAAPRDGFLNLIHVDDCARAIVQLLRRRTSSSCYVLSDGQPVLREEFYGELASHCGVDRPMFAEYDPKSSRALRAKSSKRVNPQQLFAELNFLPKFPSYVEGLRHCFAAGSETGG